MTKTNRQSCAAVLAAASMLAPLAEAAPSPASSGGGDLKPVVALLGAAKAACTPTKVRRIGSGPTPVEVACADGSGLIVLDEGGRPAAHSCADYWGGVDQCKLTDKPHLLAWLGRTASAGQRPCSVANFRFLAPGEGGGAYYELACRAGASLVLQTTAAGRYKSVVACDQWKWRHTTYRCNLPPAGRGPKA